MELIAQLIDVALQELHDLDVIDLSDMDTFEAECEIEFVFAVWVIALCGWYVFVDMWSGKPEAYYATAIADCEVPA